MKQPLPIGIQSFREIREKGYLYVDKTAEIFNLIESGKYHFLSRPRRFGKSLTLSTISELFSGSRELFKNLWIDEHWSWEQIQPVIHFSFSSIGYKTAGLEQALQNMLNAEAAKNGIVLKAKGYDQKFKELLEKLSAKGQVVLLIDEYDKPMIDYLDEKETALGNQQILKAFYSIIKDADPFISFLLITGVSKFSKVSIFSELNNLKDITIHPKFSTLVGYTQKEVEQYFSSWTEELMGEYEINEQELIQRIRSWYNGYSWDGKHFVYNPFSILSFFDTGQFQNYWFSTGTPTFLIKLLKERMVYETGETEVGQVAFDGFDLENIDTISLLFQTGYLTIKAIAPLGLYKLDYPNKEVKDSMLQYLLLNQTQ
ncbi:MAG: AAA family ATPase [Saprospiraceae bacterium]